MSQLRDEIHRGLLARTDPDTRRKLARTVPGANAMGVPVPKLREWVADFRQAHKDITLERACDLMDELCQRRLREEILFGTFLLAGYRKQVANLTWNRLAPWIDALDNWETCDQLASNVSGEVVAANLKLIDRLMELGKSENPWKRRFALATASELNHKGRSHPQEALRICQPLLADPVSSVRKAVGWAIKEASKKDPDTVFEFLLENRTKTPAGVLREASEKLSDTQRKKLLSQ